MLSFPVFTGRNPDLKYFNENFRESSTWQNNPKPDGDCIYTQQRGKLREIPHLPQIK